jgi:small subunit ribosomal protein S7
MRGGARYKKHPRLPDGTYQSVLVSQFTNYVMLGGNKAVSEQLVKTALARLEELAKKPALEAFEASIKNVSPLLEVRSRRIGGATYQVPVEVRPERKVALAMKWIIEAARGRRGKPSGLLLAEELFDAYQATGAAMKKREDKHKMAEANRAFAHFARY